MKKVASAICTLFLTPLIAPAQTTQGQEQVEMEWMTSPEIYSAIHEHGKMTAIVFTGGTEQRGPHGVLGGHTFMARGISAEIARTLGNALVAPVLAFSPTSLVGPRIPGGVALSPEVFRKVNEAVVESLITGGFKNVILMGDHGSGQEELDKMAQVMDAKYAPQGIRVVFCKDVYEKAREVFDNYAKSTMKEGFAYGTHAGLYDTSLLLYLQPRPEAYVRNNYKAVTPHPGPVPGPPRDRSQRGIGVSRDLEVSKRSRNPGRPITESPGIRDLLRLNLARR
jgi:creatinine amidohydrolase/Fe(II)-dependent formamide hydrolase-like protein